MTGVLAGIPILIFTVLAFWFWKKNKWIPIISVLTLFGMGFQAWLGKTVVDSNLAPYKITIHMVMALLERLTLSDLWENSYTCPACQIRFPQKQIHDLNRL